MFTFKNLGRFSRNLQLNLLFLIPFVVAFLLYVSAEKNVDRANDLRYISYVLADELRQSSDDLTRLARTYVITLDPQYKKHYQDILDIRNGLKPRPEAYNRIYWDLVLDDGKPPRGTSATAIPLLDLMRRYGFSSREMAKLSESKQKSDRLVEIEMEAMRLAESTGPNAEGDRQRGRLMLHDRRYHEAKASIMSPIDDFYVLVDSRTAAAVLDAQRRALLLRSLFVGFAGVLLFMLWRTYKSVYETLGGTPDEVFFHLGRMGQGDFSSAIPAFEASAPSVMKSLAETQSKLALAERERRRTEKLRGQILAIFQSSSDAIISKNLDGIVTSWNPAAARMFGYTEQEMLGEPIQVLLPPECDDADRQILARVGNGETIEHFETLRQRKGGEVFPVSVSISPIRDASGAVIGISKIARDISARKQAEAYRRMGQDILKALNDMDSKEAAIQRVISLVRSVTGVDAVGIRLESGDDYPYFCQEGFSREFLHKENSLTVRNRDGGVCRDDCGGICLQCTCGLVISGETDASSQLFTARGSAWTNDSFAILELPADEDPRVNPRNECIHQGYASVALVPLRAKGGIVGLLQLNDRRNDRFTREKIEILEDIAENIGEAMLRKQAEEELRNSKELVLNLLQSTDQGIFGVDLAGNCIFINKSALDMLGYDAGSCLGVNMHRLVHYKKADGSPFPEEECPIFARRFTRDGFRASNEVYWRRDGSPLSVEYSSYPLIENDAIVGAVVSFADISARNQAQAEKRELESQLAQAQKLESIGSLAGWIAHDFNNKLSVILGCTYLMEAEQEPVQLQALVQEVRKAAEQSADLTRQLLAFARKQVIAPEVLDLNDTIGGMLKMLARLIGENIKLSWHPAAQMWPLRLDPSQVDQILANLCVNARDSITGNGCIRIEVDNRTIDDGYCTHHLEATPGDYVRITVSDNGCGMSKDLQSRIFEPFFTTKGYGKGTGLGLATVFGIVKQNDGFINVYSEPGLGTTLSLYFPRYVSEPPPAGETQARQAAPVGQETLLLVEDDAGILGITAKILEMQGYIVLQAGGFEEALRLTRENANRIQLLITDVVMPEANGRDLSDAVREVCPLVGCLFMSGYTADVIGHHGVLDEGINFIQKPFSLLDLATKVREILDERKHVPYT